MPRTIIKPFGTSSFLRRRGGDRAAQRRKTKLPKRSGTPPEKAGKEMREASKRLEFEYAAVLRDRIIELRGQ